MRRHTYDRSPPRASHRSRINRGSCFRTAQKDPSQGRGSPSWEALVAKPGTQCRRNHSQASVCYIRCEEYTLFLNPCSGTRSPSQNVVQQMWSSPDGVVCAFSIPRYSGEQVVPLNSAQGRGRGSQGVHCEESKTTLLDLQS